MGFPFICPLAATMLGLIVACSTTGGAATPSATPPRFPAPAAPSASPPSAVPSRSHTPSPASGTASDRAVDTADEAIAAVVAQHPEYAGYGQRLGAGGGAEGSPAPIVGGSMALPRTWVVARMVAHGFEVTFFTGTGDCPAGCTEYRVETFRVSADGSVVRTCSGEATAADLVRGRTVPHPGCEPAPGS